MKRVGKEIKEATTRENEGAVNTREPPAFPALPLVLPALFLAAAVTVSKTVRWPNDWSEAHWLLSYEFGLIKRGLPGTLLSPLVDGNAELAIRVVSAVLLVLFLVALFWICVRVVRWDKSNPGGVLVLLLFLTSPYVLMSAHLNGYFDNILILITVLACVLVKKKRIFFGALMVSVGFFVHEKILVVGFPSVVLFALLQHAGRPSSSAVEWLTSFLSRYGLLLFLPVSSFFCLALYDVFFFDPAIWEQIASHLSQSYFVGEERAVRVPEHLFATSWFQHLETQLSAFGGRLAGAYYLVNFGVPMIVILVYGCSRLQSARLDPEKTLLCMLAFVAVVLLPLSLHAVAWDATRIWTFPLVVALLGVWAMTESLPARRDQGASSILFCMFALLVTVVQMLFELGPFLMDGEVARFSAAARALLYAPSLVLLAVFMINSYHRGSLKKDTRL